ncbi:MAG: hypothetical protein VKK97_08670 [Synechococcaceae cyanobacterium]|nr:hypothetical protein [Synechococcaceae cyanobacterium]
MSASVEAEGTTGMAPAGWRGVAIDAPGPRFRLVRNPNAAREASDVSTSTATGPTSVPAARLESEQPPADAQFVAAAPRLRPYLISPSLGGGLPSGYVGGWGDYFLAGSAGTAGKLRDGSPDSSINMGLGFGDPVKSLGLSVNWGIGSIKNFNANGSVGVSAGRILVSEPDRELALAVGLVDAYTYGNEPGQTPANVYGALTLTLPLRRDDPNFQQRLQLTVGGGGSSFAAIDANFQTSDSGLFAAAGLDVSPNLGLSVGVSSRSTNLNLSWIPFRDLPVFVNVVAADLFNATPWGTVGVLSVGWGDSLKLGFFNP